MLTLLLLRHAKSDRDNPALADTDRPLNKRGQQAAARMGAYIARNGLVPYQVLCSPALRTRQTWDTASSHMVSPPQALICRELYDFGDGTPLLSCLKQNGEGGVVMVLSHNPSIHYLALCLAGSGDPSLRQQLKDKFPTAALAAISFSAARWSDIAEDTGKLERFIRPRDLGDQD